jgi:hypothetical protein
MEDLFRANGYYCSAADAHRSLYQSTSNIDSYSICWFLGHT